MLMVIVAVLTLVATLSIGVAAAPADGKEYNITSEADIIAAIADAAANPKQVWNIKNNIEVNSRVNVVKTYLT